MLGPRLSQTRNWLARLPTSKSLLLGLDAFPLSATDSYARPAQPQRLQTSQSSAAAAFSKALLNRPSQRANTSVHATALELDEIEVLASPQEVQAEQQRQGPFDQLGCDDRVTVDIYNVAPIRAVNLTWRALERSGMQQSIQPALHGSVQLWKRGSRAEDVAMNGKAFLETMDTTGLLAQNVSHARMKTCESSRFWLQFHLGCHQRAHVSISSCQEEGGGGVGGTIPAAFGPVSSASASSAWASSRWHHLSLR